MRNPQEVKHAFTPTGPLKAPEQMKVMHIQTSFLDMALEIMDKVPDCPDRTAALRKLLEAKFTCIQAITHATVEAPKTEVKDEKKTANK